MKVLFAINNDNDLNAIIKKYQKDYREILSYKNVYYFNAIIKELQKDKIYDRVVISEDLEPFANNNYEIIDKFLVDKLGKISAESKKINGEKIDIVLICSERRTRSDDIINKYFKMGINNVIIKPDINIEQVCKLINSPRNEAEARKYYGLAQASSANQENSENYVSEAEVQNIIMHYKRLGKNEDKYVESFNNIVTQYTDDQLRIIINYLPLQVKAVLEERSKKYQQLMTFSRSKPKYNTYNSEKQETIGVKMLENSSSKEKIHKPIVIPSNIKSAVKKEETVSEEKHKVQDVEIPDLEVPKIEEITEIEEIPTKDELPEVEAPKKRGRGRPKKVVDPQEVIEEKPKRGRGRPKKVVEEVKVEEEPKQEVEEDDEFLDLFNLDVEEDKKSEPEAEENEFVDLFSMDEEEQEDETIDLFNLDTEEEEETSGLFSAGSEDEAEEQAVDLFSLNDEQEESAEESISSLQETTSKSAHNISTLLTSDKKVISFVGTTKNGTSFIVNNVAALLSSMGISTAILDMTVSKNAYYIYTNNEESLRNIAKDSVSKLEKGIASGIKINKNLTVYTSLPGYNEKYTNLESIIATLVQNHSAVLIDTDFSTPKEIFEISQEIYLVQSMDVLTIQPLTAFLRNLKSKGALKPEKLKVVINKALKVKNLSEKVLIGGMAYYNDPAMSFMTELFNKDAIMYCTIPFEPQNYAKYLEALVNCQVNLSGYTKQFMYSLNELGNMVYPLINKKSYKPMGNKRETFSSEVNDTLNKMKNNY